MKIEMGESLVYSWLKHVKGCQAVQMNWKSSPRWQIPGDRRHNEVLEEARAFFQQKIGSDIFKKTSSITQLMRQAEIDVLGFSVDEGRVQSLHAVEVAFHEAGLNYGDKTETMSRVVKKMVRAAFVLDIFFPGLAAEIHFVSPKVNPSIHEALTVGFDCLRDFSASVGWGYAFKLCVNGGFHEIILCPVLEIAHAVADSSELFLRSHQLLKIFDGCNEDGDGIQPKATGGSPPVPGGANSTATGNQVIKTLLPITLDPSPEAVFKKAFLTKRRATIMISYSDGRVEKKIWDLKRFGPRSGVLKNLRSRPEFRQGWQQAGIESIHVAVDS